MFTGAELEAMTVPGPDPLLAIMGGGGPTPEYTLLATDKVRFVGDPVAVVVAESRYLAEDGCELVEVDYADLPPVVTRLPPSTPAARRCSPTWTTTSSARTSAASSATSRARSRTRTGSPSSTSTCTATRTCHGGTRHRGESRRRHRHHDGVRGDAGRPHDPDGHRHASRHGAEKVHVPRGRYRRLVRVEDWRLPRGARRRGRVARASAGRSSGSRTAARTSRRPGRRARRASTSGPPSVRTACCAGST